jgi:hypothetical protein
MNTNKSNVSEMSSELLVEVKADLAEVQAKLKPYISSLSRDEKRKLPKMGDSTVAFVNKVIGYAETNPEYSTPIFDIPKLKANGAAITALSPLSKTMKQISDNMQDTLTLAGSEAYDQALIYYNVVKQAAGRGMPGAKSMYEDLRHRFPGRPHTKSDPPAPGE